MMIETSRAVINYEKREMRFKTSAQRGTQKKLKKKVRLKSVIGAFFALLIKTRDLARALTAKRMSQPHKSQITITRFPATRHSEADNC